MGHRTDTTYHLSREEADAAQKDRGTPGYSETYSKGVFPCKVIHPETKETVDGWKSVTETYYG
jgi:hypothetical protein